MLKPCPVACCIVLCWCWLFVFMLIALLHCRPIHLNWSGEIESPEHCFALKPYTIAQTIWGLVMDAVMWSLPHFVVWRLQLRYAHKIAISIVFALGSLSALLSSRLVCLSMLMAPQQHFCGRLPHRVAALRGIPRRPDV